MWARVTTFQFPPDEVDSAVASLNAAVEAFSTQPGLERFDVFVNRRSGAGITITFWNDHDALTASEDEADRLRGEIALEVAGWIQSVEEYELVRSQGS